MAREKSFKEAVMGIPFIYRTALGWLAKSSASDYLVSEFIQPRPKTTVLDVGCGVASILEFLGDVEYIGVDHNPDYIAKAQEVFGTRGSFHVADVSEVAGLATNKFDRILLLGVLHHLTDTQCDELLGECSRLLDAGGALITFDCALTDDQHWIARRLAKADRGHYARSPDHYLRLISPHFGTLKTDIRHNLLRVPYTHFAVRASS
jgi:ubiquinone/menaquinone biosynthesis C-methylase UbiE